MTQLLSLLLTLHFSLSSPAMEGNADFWHSTLAAKNVTKEIKANPSKGGERKDPQDGKWRPAPMPPGWTPKPR